MRSSVRSAARQPGHTAPGPTPKAGRNASARWVAPLHAHHAALPGEAPESRRMRVLARTGSRSAPGRSVKVAQDASARPHRPVTWRRHIGRAHECRKTAVAANRHDCADPRAESGIALTTTSSQRRSAQVVPSAKCERFAEVSAVAFQLSQYVTCNDSALVVVGPRCGGDVNDPCFHRSARVRPRCSRRRPLHCDASAPDARGCPANGWRPTAVRLDAGVVGSPRRERRLNAGREGGTPVRLVRSWRCRWCSE